MCSRCFVCVLMQSSTLCQYTASSAAYTSFPFPFEANKYVLLIILSVFRYDLISDADLLQIARMLGVHWRRQMSSG